MLQAKKALVLGFFAPDKEEINNLQGTSETGVQKLMGNILCHFSQQHKAQRNAL